MIKPWSIPPLGAERVNKRNKKGTMNVNELQFYPFVNTYPSIQQTFSSIENWKNPEAGRCCYRSCRFVVEWSYVYWAFITINRSVLASVMRSNFIYVKHPWPEDAPTCSLFTDPLLVFKVRWARVIKYKPQGIYWPMFLKRTKRKIKHHVNITRLCTG